MNVGVNIDYLLDWNFV